MLKPETEAPWGNHVGFLPLRIPIMKKVDNAMEFVTMAKQIMDRYKISLGVFMNATLLGYLTRLKGPQVRTFQMPITKKLKSIKSYPFLSTGNSTDL